jgi:hypothetical protein
MTRTLAAAGAVLVSWALWFSFGTLELRALALVTLAALAAVAAAVGSRTDGPPRSRWTRGVLWVGVAAGIGLQLLAIPGDRRAPAHHPYFDLVAWIALCFVLTYLLPRPPRWLERSRFALLAACFLLLTAIAFRTDRLPFVDSWFLRQEAASAFLAGANPYQLSFPNIYPHERFYGPAFLENHRVVVFPYPPLVLLLDLPSFLLAGDVRWSCVAAMVLGASTIARLGPRPEAELAGLLVLFQPRTLYVAEVSWTEPFVIATWAAALLALRRWHTRPPAGAAPAGAALGLLLAAKQYAPLFLVPLVTAAPTRGRRCAALIGLALVAALTVPFAVWNARELWRDLVVAQVLQPFRMDALSWLAAWARKTGAPPPSAAIGFLLSGAVLGAGIWRQRALAGAAVTAGAAFVVFLLFNKQAFCNYYWLAVGVLASASVIAADATHERTREVPAA